MSATGVDTSLEATIERLQRRIDKLKQRQKRVRENVALAEKLDFEALNKRDWDLFRSLHTEDVKVTMGSMVDRGVDAHLQTMQGLLGSTDSRIASHDVAFGGGEWTCCVATASDSTNGDGRRSAVCSVARWRNGRIAEEYRFIADSPEVVD
jgi:hypothetical protein